MIDVEASRHALVELRHARRHNHRDAVHWIDALYRVYISGLVVVIAIALGSGVFGETVVSAPDALAFATEAAPWLGLAFAVAAGIGLRSGGRGGPLTLEAASIQYELLAPLEYGTTLREPARKLLRFMSFTGLCVGGVVGVLGVRPFEHEANAVVLVATCAVAFSLAATGAVCLAMIVSGRRWGIRIGNGLALLLLAWSAIDIWAKTTTSPFTLLATLALAAIHFDPLCIVAVVIVLAAVPVAMVGIGGTSIDDARRRAGLVSQLRFAVTLQDIRTVVLLRRQLAQETPRGTPWVRMKRGGRLPPIWKRDWRSYFRFPVVRVLRMVLLAVVAGITLGLTWRGIKPAFLLSAIALYLAAYDAVEPLAQEVDHPSRWDGIPEEHGRTLIQHLPAAFVVMVFVCLLTAAASLVLVPASVVAPLLILIVPVAASSMAGAALSTVMGSPDVAKIMGGMGADIIGFVLLFRLIAPPALTVAALAPMFTVGSNPDAIDTTRASNLVGYTVVASVLALLYVYYQKPARI